MARRHRSYSLEFKRHVAQQYLSGEISLARLARQHDISRNLIRVWIAKYEAGEFDDEQVQGERRHPGIFKRIEVRVLTPHADEVAEPLRRVRFDIEHQQRLGRNLREHAAVVFFPRGAPAPGDLAQVVGSEPRPVRGAAARVIGVAHDALEPVLHRTGVENEASAVVGQQRVKMQEPVEVVRRGLEVHVGERGVAAVVAIQRRASSGEVVAHAPGEAPPVVMHARDGAAVEPAPENVETGSGQSNGRPKPAWTPI